MVPVNCHIILELIPEVLGQPKIDEGKLQHCHPVPQNLSESGSASTQVDDRTNHRPVQEAKHCCVKLMCTEEGMIHIMGETRNKWIPIRHRGHLHE